MTRRWLVLTTLLLGGSCDDPGDTFLDVTYDPCQPLVVAPAADTTPEELAGIDEAIAMWNQVADTQLTREDIPGAARVPIAFESAPLAFYGVYQDESGDILINRRLTDPQGRAVTIAHELGHAMGLWHVPSGLRVSVMNAPNLTIVPTPADAASLVTTWGACQ